MHTAVEGGGPLLNRPSTWGTAACLPLAVWREAQLQCYGMHKRGGGLSLWAKNPIPSPFLFFTFHFPSPYDESIKCWLKTVLT